MDKEHIERYRRKAMAMLRSYNNNKVQIEILDSQIKELSSRTDVGSMAIAYDQPNVGQTNKTTSTVEAILISKGLEIERLQNELAKVQGQIERVDIALGNMPYAQRTLLQQRFIECRLWQDIADFIGYDVSYVKKEMRRSAIDMLVGYLFGAGGVDNDT